MTLRTLKYGNYGIFLIMGNAGFCPSAVSYYTLITLGIIGAWGSKSFGLLVGIPSLGFRLQVFSLLLSRTKPALRSSGNN